jgi:hypothetical protein
VPEAQHQSRKAARVEAARRRRRTRRFAWAAGLVVVVVAVVGVVVGPKHGGSPARQTKRVAKQTAPATLNPPPPIPGYMLIADRGNNRMLLVDGAKRIVWRYPRSGVAGAMAFRFDDDTFFGPRHDRIISNQEDQHTIQIISFPGGHVLWRYGHVNVKGSAPGYLNTPDDAYLLPGGIVTVADAYNCRVLFISASHRIVRQYGSGVCRHNPPPEVGAVNGATPLADGGTLVSEINGSWVDDFGPTGQLRWSVAAPVSYPSDPQLLAPNRILLADYARPGHAIIMTRTGRVLWRYGPASGPGALDHPSLARRIAPGLIAINDDYRDRIVVISIRTKKIVWQYGHTDAPGTAAGYLNTPDGLDVLGTADARKLPFMRALVRAADAHRAVRQAPTGAAALIVRAAPYRLPAPVEREVAAAAGGAVLLAGGLDAAQQSTNGVFRMDAASGKRVRLGSVPEPFHDAAGAVLGPRLLIFGGGAAQSSSSVQAFDLRTHRGSVVARLPRPVSDLAAATVGGTVYLVGGYDGHAPRAEIYSTTDGLHYALVGRLPVGLRYPAVAAVGHTVVIAGGTAAGGPTSSVYAFDTASRRLRLLGQLAAPVAHASALAFSGSVYVLGGIGASAITRIEVGARRITTVTGRVDLSDAGAVAVGGRGLLIGGERGGRAVPIVLELF